MKLLNYTRLPLEDAIYANRLAYSMHLALWNEKDGCYTALNHNSGVLFVKATENEDGSLNPKSMKNPWLLSHSVLSDSLQPQGLWPARLLFLWNFPSKNTGVGCHFFHQGIFPDPGIEPGSPALQADS